MTAIHLPLKSSFFKDLGLTSNRLVTSDKKIVKHVRYLLVPVTLLKPQTSSKCQMECLPQNLYVNQAYRSKKGLYKKTSFTKSQINGFSDFQSQGFDPCIETLEPTVVWFLRITNIGRRMYCSESLLKKYFPVNVRFIYLLPLASVSTNNDTSSCLFSSPPCSYTRPRPLEATSWVRSGLHKNKYLSTETTNLYFHNYKSLS